MSEVDDKLLIERTVDKYKEYIADIYSKVCDFTEKAKELKKRAAKARVPKKAKPKQLVETAKVWAEIAADCQSLISDFSGSISLPEGISEEEIKVITDKVMGAILSEMQLTMMQVKKIVLEMEKKIEEYTRKCLVAVLSGKGAADPVTIAVPLAALQAVAVAANVIQMVITAITAMFVPPMLVAPQGLTMFMTPKSMMNMTIPIANEFQFNADNVPTFVKQAIDIAIFAVNTANNALRLANIVAGAAKCVAMVKSGATSVTDLEFCIELQKINENAIFRAVNALINSCFAPLPLPRFEKLRITNIGYLNWLITGFEPVVKQTFGIPGMP